MKHTVLLIEDSRSTAEFMTYFLEKAGFMVVVATNAGLGIELLKRSHPDLVVCDIRLPGMDGWEFARTVKADPELRNIPLVACSNNAFEEDQRKSIEAGFAAHISKPLDPRTIARDLLVHIK